MDLMPEPDSLRASIRSDLGGMFDDLRRFVDRRIAELSMEISATVQLVDFSETNLSDQLARIQEQMASVLAVPNQQARNSGLELDAVVQVTETAANQIMEAAEAIDSWLREGTRDADGLQAVSDRINAIFEACSFQDLTSQRIRRAIAHLQQVDDMLSGIASGAKPTPAAPGIMPIGGSGADLAQDDIDSLFN